ncbi:hypothetical protein ASPZODRAFT_68845 [Penicilliopsis zonata CBS 506.65]|uniref:Malate dehydrogenase n=1 Tax=Penicilliopsis zonata CBS 506.65 TaxID=1073090 RepID=A0A1L9SEM5_9EURO|nr:hypothetical protein ASPZODRAFT_68845 [Penicilliopsis zonata CBS 506.65]OJJ45656.1 hypothetical protein ASPZODRAFT_68845 [Penicilliopsis zonata CBS 506.65]
MRSISLFLAGLMASIAFAAPAPGIFNNAYKRSNRMEEYYSRVSKHIHDSKRTGSASSTCDTSSISLPAYASSLPSPSGQTLAYVTVGVGTQNYTCANSSASATPEAIGALAGLFNATCIAADYPEIIDLLPNIVYDMDVSANATSLSMLPPANLLLLGYQYFSDLTTPVFDLDTEDQNDGIAYTKKNDTLDAPSDAIQGAYGAVQWLYLTTTNETVGKYSSIYRVMTAGGDAPTTCEGMPDSFTVPYAANYYIYET